ncbi:MAG: hypothetical protein ABIH11_07470 [Candidatus Altiarchaeota archaeon]
MDLVSGVLHLASGFSGGLGVLAGLLALRWFVGRRSSVSGGDECLSRIVVNTDDGYWAVQ